MNQYNLSAQSPRNHTDEQNPTWQPVELIKSKIVVAEDLLDQKRLCNPHLTAFL